MLSATLPMAVNGHIGRAFQNEFSLYPTKEARDKKKKMIDAVHSVTDNEAVLAALDYLDGYPSGRKRKIKKKKNESNITYYN